MARVEVTDPHSGAVLSVDAESVQAKLWSKPEPKPEPVKRKPAGKKSK